MRRPMVVWLAVLAGSQVFSGGAALADVLPKPVVGLFVLAVAACQAGTLVYQQKSAQINAEGLGGSDGQ